MTRERFAGTAARWVWQRAVIVSVGLGLGLVLSCSTDDGAGRSRSSGAGATGAVGVGGGSLTPGAGGAGAALAFGGQSSTGGAGPAPTSTIDPAAIAGGVQPANFEENVGNVDAATVASLTTGGAPAGGTRWLYPYERTVFPAGLPSPLLMWDGPGADSLYLHLTSTHFEYKGYFGANPDRRLPIPQHVWDAAFLASEGAADPLTIAITTIGGGAVSGPIVNSVTLARGVLKGSVYYNTYHSPKAASQGVTDGVVMRIPLGRLDPDVFLRAAAPGNCVGCHSVSADGTRMVVEEHVSPGLAYGTSRSYALAAGQTVQPPIQSELGNSKAAFSAVFPDGSRYLTTGRPTAGPMPNMMDPQNVVGTFGPEPALLWDTNTGLELPNTGIVPFAKMPSFSTSGRQVVFSDDDIGHGRGLVVMDFDAAANRFSGYRSIFTSPDLYAGWPWFLPDERAVLFSLTDGAGYTPMFTSLGGLHIVDLTTGQAMPLARLMGYRDPGLADRYVPHPEDVNHDYVPTMLPVAAGGYFWAFFSTDRSYGNLTPPASGKEQIWVSAIRILGPGETYTSDPSAPPFYLVGQEFESSNLRAFSSLDACRADGAGCSSGIDCCVGFCTNGACGVPVEPRCALIDEACATVADCCEGDDPQVGCISGYCARREPIIIQ